jgi:hypothetical protein
LRFLYSTKCTLAVFATSTMLSYLRNKSLPQRVENISTYDSTSLICFSEKERDHKISNSSPGGGGKYYYFINISSAYIVSILPRLIANLDAAIPSHYFLLGKLETTFLM